MTQIHRLLLAAPGAGEDTAGALEQQLSDLLPGLEVHVLRGTPAHGLAEAPAGVPWGSGSLLVLLADATEAAPWLDAAVGAGSPLVLLPGTPLEPTISCARRVAGIVRGAMAGQAAAVLHTSAPPGADQRSVQPGASSSLTRETATGSTPAQAPRTVTECDLGYVRELRHGLAAARGELQRVQASPIGRAQRWSTAALATLGRVVRRVAHPAETARVLAAEHLPPGWRARAVTLLHRLGPRRTETVGQPTHGREPYPVGGRPPRARPTVICLAERPWSDPVGRPQQLMTHLARRGWPVLYVSRPVPEERPTAGGRLPVADGVSMLCLAGDLTDGSGEPRPDNPALVTWVAQFAAARTAAQIREAVIVVQRLDWWPLAERLREAHGWPVVYDRTERRWDPAEEGPRIRAREARIMRAADGIWAASAKLERTAPATSRFIARVGNACDTELFGRPSGEPPELPPRPRIGCHAPVDPLLDWELLRELAHARPEWSLVLTGPVRGVDCAPLLALPNVHLLPPGSREALAATLAALDVGILPYVQSRLAEGMDPVELHEMAAAGLAIVGTPLPELAVRTDLVRTAEGPRELLAAVEEALAKPRDPTTVQARRQQAGSWDDRALAAEESLEQLFPLVSIIIVTYNNAPLTRLCLESVFTATEYPSIEVVVIDNASADETPTVLAEMARDHANLRVERNDRNLGFAVATNQGVRLSRGEVLCLLNNDTVVTRGWLSALVQALLSNPGLGMVGPVTNAVGNEARIRARYSSLDELPAWAARYTWAHDGESVEMSMLALFCAALRRDVWERVGELDEQFEIGMFEDDDYCRRVRRAGLELRCLRHAFVHHWQRASFRLLGDEAYWRLFTANRARFRAKWRA